MSFVVELQEPPASYGNGERDYEYRVRLVPFKHKGGDQIGIKPSKTGAPFLIVKNLGALYTATHKMYYLAHTSSNVNRIFEAFKNIAWIDITELQDKKLERVINKKRKDVRLHINAESSESLQKFKNYMVARSFSKSTINTYYNMVQSFLGFFSEKSAEHISNDDAESYLNDHVVGSNYSVSYQRQVISALKCFYATRFDVRLNIDKLPSIKKERKLPKVLAKSEVEGIIKCTHNLKHKSMLILVYACGLRISELINLKPKHIDSARKMLVILSAKGKKDRLVTISDKLIEILRSYYIAYRPSNYLFEGQMPGSPYSPSSFNKVLKASARRAGVKKNVHAHMLRHSYATHLLENGTDLRYIQTLLGHNSSKTTEIYTFVSQKSIANIASPFDDLDV